MGWTCQHDYKGYCKLIQKECIPGDKGCILKSSEYIFCSKNYHEDKNEQETKKKDEIDFSELARSN